MRVDPSNPRQREEFEQELAEQAMLGASGLDRAAQMIGEMARSRDGREYLERELGAQAMTFGSSITIAPDQARHVAHEAWHVVQQKEGRVRR